MDQNLKKQKEEKIVKDAQERILKLLTEYKIPEADEEYEKVRGLLRQSWYATQRFPFHKEVERRERQEVEAKLRRIKAEEWKKQHRKEEKEQEEQQERGGTT